MVRPARYGVTDPAWLAATTNGAPSGCVRRQHARDAAVLCWSRLGGRPTHADGSRVKGAALPRPTDDLGTVHTDLEEHGYALLADALPPAELGEVRARLVEQAAAEAHSGVAYFDTEAANQRVFMLLNKGQVFRDLVLRPVTRSLMEHLLGPGCLVSSLTANIAGPGGHEMGLHTDQGYVPPPYPYPLVANVMWLLDDFTADNGATLLVPGSHRLDGSAPPTAPPIAAEAPAGTGLVFDGRLWHGTGANRTGTPRHGILSYHCRPFMRQQENYFLGLSDEVRRSAPGDCSPCSATGSGAGWAAWTHRSRAPWSAPASRSPASCPFPPRRPDGAARDPTRRTSSNNLRLTERSTATFARCADPRPREPPWTPRRSSRLRERHCRRSTGR